MNKNTFVIKLLNNRALNLVQKLITQVCASYIVAGALLAMLEVITVKEYTALLIISAVALVAQLITEHYREALTD